MRPSASIRLAPVLGLALLAACSQQPAGRGVTPASGATVSPQGTSSPVISAPAPPDTAALPGDHASTRHYRIAISLPTLPGDEAPLAAALRTTADHAKHEFLQALPDPEQLPEFAGRQFQLLLKFDVVANTPAFTSVRETGEQDTGGAHPIPVQAAFVFDRKAGRLVTLDDLFADADGARRALANFAHDHLLRKFLASAPKPGEGSPAALGQWKANMVQMLDDGTKPTTVNYSTFAVRAGTSATAPSPGLTLVFPPYQVAPYVYGTQTVEVPTGVFAKFLKPAYQKDFATQ